VKAPRPPRFEKRRAADFSAELRTRAQAWLPAWDLPESRRDFGYALLEIAARFNSEVAERLDDVGEKMRRGFLDWLAVRGMAARPSRLPVVLKLADSAPEAVLASAPVQLQAEADGSSVMLETEEDLRIVPGRLDVIVGVDADKDEFYLSPPGLSDLKTPEPLPTQWRLKSFAAAGAKNLQLDPDTGLVLDMIVEAEGKQYKITQAEKDIVTLEPPLGEGLNEGQVVEKVTTFVPFGGIAHNWQEHVLYLGDADLLNIEAEAKIEVVGAKSVGDDVSWQYSAGDEKDWQPLKLAERQTSDGVVLMKPKGAIETKKVKEISSRWIRAYKKTATGAPFRTNRELGLRINSIDCDKKLKNLKCEDTESTPSAAAEAMANTTPLVLDTPFFPLGKQPKQFDAFYLGSEEAFSKKKAEVQLCFQLADLSFAALSTVAVDQPTPGTSIIAGVGQDRFLHLLQFNPTSRTLTKFRDREPLQPPLSGFFGAAPSTPNPVALDSQPLWRLPMWVENSFDGLFGQELLVAMTAGNDVWLWREMLNLPVLSGWFPLGQLPVGGTGTPVPVAGLLYLADAAQSKIVALCHSKLFVRDWPAETQWQPVDTLDAANNPVVLRSVVPVLLDNGSGQLVTSVSAGMVGVSDTNDLYSVDTAGLCTFLANGFETDIRPAAFRDSTNITTVVGVDLSDPPKLIAFRNTASSATVDVPSSSKVVRAIEVMLSNSELHFLVSAKGSASSYLVDWTPFGVMTTPIASEVPPEVGQVGGAPCALLHGVIIPGANADLLVTDFDVTRRKVRTVTIEIGIVVPDSIPALAVNDKIVRKAANGGPEHRLVTGTGLTKAGETFYPIDSDFPPTTTGPLLAYKLPATLSGEFKDPVHHPKQFTLDSSDHETAKGSWLLIDSRFYTVDDLNTTVDPWIATISSPTTNSLPASPPNTKSYVRPITTDGRVAPFMHLDSTNNDWDAGLLQRIKLVFPGRNPSEQSGKAFSFLGNNPVYVVLGQIFNPMPPPANPIEFIVNVAAGKWIRLLGDTSANPELSWEYWNGKGWWKLPVESDATFNLKNSGALEFEIPDDIAATDWSGKTNFWIRARLVGGDYGQEKVTVITTTSGNVSEQTIERSSEGIRAPQVVKLHIFYRICEPAIPKYVLTQDSGSMRDQSDANRTAGASVEAFVPLALALGRLSQVSTPAATSDDCPPDCCCHGEKRTAASASIATTEQSTVPTQPTGGRALFIGLDATLSGAPVNVFLLVEQERPHGEFAPLKIEALVADRFVPIVADDGTRAVGESGLLSMAFVDAPTRGELFGKTLTWLRLTPTANGNTDWKPTLRGAYLNAVWASATETLTRELVGSSDGSPNLTLRLARPPVLHGTLELRVKEPLGDEERTALRKDDARRVLSDVQDLPGDWVLWKQVADPGDESTTERVYAFDESTGEIRFGDGRHGMIPPIGRDVIVAFRYQRTEPPKPGSDTVPGNLIAPRTPLNLVSPVESVEGVFAADQAAGGAPPESDERVLRFGFARLRHRHRAVTPQDLEDLALESSPDIAQARCFFRPGFIRLVIVMRGKNPSPNAAQIRELHRLLTAVAPPSLSEQGALRIVGPSPRRLRVALTLRVESLDRAGALSEDVKKRLVALFDTATGGSDGDGWALGTNPSEEDIALALVDANHLESIAKVTFHEVAGDGLEQAWPATFKPSGLVVLDKDPVRIQFVTAEVMV